MRAYPSKRATQRCFQHLNQTLFHENLINPDAIQYDNHSRDCLPLGDDALLASIAMAASKPAPTTRTRRHCPNSEARSATLGIRMTRPNLT
jgi:hypothetical protein